VTPPTYMTADLLRFVEARARAAGPLSIRQ